MRLFRAIFPLVLTAMTVGLASPTLVRAQGVVPGKEVAKRLFEEGIELEKKADYVAALVRYKDAEQISATPGVRFHKGYCLEMLGKLNAALDEYEAADKLAREGNRADVHAAIVARAEPLRARIPQIAIRLSTPVRDAEVQLDGAAVAAPLLDGRSFRLDPGEHAVSARAPGHRNFMRRVVVPEAVTTSVDVYLERARITAPVVPGAAAPAATDGPPAEAPRARSLSLPIATTVGTIALLGAGIVFFEVAGSAQADGRTSCLQKVTCDSEQSKVRTLDALALGSFLGAAGLGVLSVVLWTSKERATSLAARPSAVVLEGSF